MTHWLEEIIRERLRQDKKWGVQDHGDERWLAILVEEVGEAARAFLKGYDGDHGLKTELVLVAAVALAWLESIDRRVK